VDDRNGAGPDGAGGAREARRGIELGSSVAEAIETNSLTQAATDVAGSNRLAELAHGIRQEHEAVAVALKDSVRHAIAAGGAS
jgi:hypothetical protein